MCYLNVSFCFDLDQRQRFITAVIGSRDLASYIGDVIIEDSVNENGQIIINIHIIQ